MDTFTKQELKQFRIDFQNAVSDLEKKYEAKISLGDIRFSSYEFSGRITVKKTSIPISDGKTISPEQYEFEKYCELYGLQKEDFGKVLTMNGRKFKISGINTKASKNCVNITGNGKQYKTSVEQVKRALAFS